MKDRIMAALVHLLFSALVVGSLLAVVMWLWFPGPLSRVEGVAMALKVLVLVDVVLGPSLTLIVFKRGKPSLRRDLATIVAVQLTAFIYGAWVLFDSRPGVVAWDSGDVYVVRVGDFHGEPLPEWVDPVFGWYGPGWVYVEPIHDPAFINAVLRGEQPDVMHMPEQYRPVDAHLERIRETAPPVDKLLAVEALAQVWPDFADSHAVSAEEVWIFPLLGARADAGVVMRRDTGAFVGFLDVDINAVMMRNGIEAPHRSDKQKQSPVGDDQPPEGEPDAPAGAAAEPGHTA